jgi:3-deoxy-manno-octulosonate cytidylyltransferase (CMP-KDO synthetase)
MFWHVYDRARRCPQIKNVILATDDHRIYDAARSLEVPVIITGNDHVSGTDRVLEAARKLRVDPEAVVVNFQGDEPALEPAMLTQLLTPFQLPDIRVTTLARKISSDEADNFDRVKVVFNRFQDAMYFSRSKIPHPMNQTDPIFFMHIGLYAFRFKTLEQFVSLGPSRLEALEKLEQLRFLENGIPIRVVVTPFESMGVDRPEDIEKVIRLMGQPCRFDCP